MKKRIFIECTHTFFQGGNSGIQRVTRNLANHGRTCSSESLEVLPLVWTGTGFCCPTARVGLRPYLMVRVMNKIRRIGAKGTPGPVKRYLKRFTKETLARLLVKRDFLADLPYILLSIILLPSQFLLGRFVHLRHGDVVVLVDSTWRSPGLLSELFKARYEDGVQVGVMFHDLFPLTMAETCEEVTAEGFCSWFDRVAPNADFVVTNSETTRSSFIDYVSQVQGGAAPSCPSGSFRLGAELDLAGEMSKPSRYSQPIWDTPGRAILCVGTIEPRKNHMYLLDAYDMMRAAGNDVSLILVGRAGWKNEAVISRIHSHKDFGTRLLHLNDASDRDLAEAVERADCLVCPSLAEGFGLPVVEGLMLGLKVFASDIPVFREIGGEGCAYVSLNDASVLAEVVGEWFEQLNSGAQPQHGPHFVWPDWRQSAVEFVALVQRLSDEACTTRPAAEDPPAA